MTPRICLSRLAQSSSQKHKRVTTIRKYDAVDLINIPKEARSAVLYRAGKMQIIAPIPADHQL